MVDTRRLLAGLDDYAASLERHLHAIRSEYETLEKQWYAFSPAYEGDAADQFRHHWSQTSRQFQDYSVRSEAILRLLRRRIEYLRVANLPSGAL